ncbi:MAG: tripartite motif-containing protein 71 [Pseudonocardiales bacterium]|nr:tripartite motif-containing protein 71 [Pseudonocardiales bacterium]
MRAWVCGRMAAGRFRDPAAILFAMVAALVVSGVPNAAGAAAPAYSRTIGGPGHAEMYPSGVDVDPAGTLYVADTGNDQVAAYRADGTQLWRVGARGTKALGRFNNPRDVAYLNGRVYVDDTGWNRVQVLDAATGQAISAWPTRFGSTLGISAGVNGVKQPVIFVSEDIENRVREFRTDGTFVRTIGIGLGSKLGQLNAPRDAATDSNGNIYVADYNNNRIAKFSPAGKPLMVWGTRGRANGQFVRPYGVDVDDSNRIYVADSDNDRIQVFLGGGKFVHVYGSTGSGAGQFFQLRRVAVGAGKTPAVYGADLWGNKALRFTYGGTVDRVYGGEGGLDGGFNQPSGLAVDGQTFVSDSVNQRVQRFDTPSGSFERSFGHRGWGKTDLAGFNWPRDITINEATNTVWVADTKNSRLLQFTRDGLPTGAFLGAVGSGADQLHWPYGITSAGPDLIVADTFNNRVSRWDPVTGKATWVTTGLHFPKDVTVVGSTVYATDTVGGKIVALDAATGAVLNTFGGLHAPEGIAADAAGDLWVADTGWNQIVQLSPLGAVLTTFGGAGTEHGQFNHPTHLEVYAGQLFVSDEYNDRIEVFNLPG